MKKLNALITALLITVSTSLIAQDKELVYIHIQEGYSGTMLGSYMSITYNEQEAQFIDLEKIKLSGTAGVSENAKKIHSELKKLMDSGYEIKSSSVGAGDGAITTIMILVKD